MKSILRIRFATLIIVALAFITSCGISRHPSDRVLENRFQSQEAKFSRLAEMLNEDRDIARLCDDCIFLSGSSNRSISNERLSEYRRLFKELELESGIHRDNAYSVRLIASSKGLFIPTSEKSYVYSKVEPSLLVNSLDDVTARDGGDQEPVYRKLKDNWYLYYESW